MTEVTLIATAETYRGYAISIVYGSMYSVVRRRVGGSLNADQRGFVTLGRAHHTEAAAREHANREWRADMAARPEGVR